MKALLISVGLVTSLAANAQISIGAAPRKEQNSCLKNHQDNFRNCNRVTSASRRPDGSIAAVCNGTQYLVFTMLSQSDGKMPELALNCAAAAKSM